MPVDILDIAYAQPHILRTLLVGDTLTARGYAVRHMNNNARQRCLVATAPDSTTIAISAVFPRLK